MFVGATIVFSVILATAASTLAATPANADFSSTVTPVLARHCVFCHGGTRPKADLALDDLSPDFVKNSSAWQRVMERVADGSMPPKDHPRPTPDEQAAVVDWIGAGLRKSQLDRQAAVGRAQMRRLNRVEYVNTLRDLLGVNVDVESLPPDGVASGFDNVDVALDFSAPLIERYLEAADAALDAVFIKGPRPEPVTMQLDLAALARKAADTKATPRFGQSTVVRENEVVFRVANAPMRIHETGVAIPGRFRFRISANADNNGDGTTFLVYVGNYGFQPETARLSSAYDVGDKPTVVEFTETLKAKESIRIAPYGLPTIWKDLPEDYNGPGLAVQWIEIEGPLVGEWPPAATVRLLGNVNLATGTAEDAAAILRRFVPRAFRRNVSAEELAPYVDLVKSQLSSIKDVRRSEKFELALRVALKAVLCSPDFLYLHSQPGKLNDYDLASRLSYFLWSTMPDDALLDLARQGRMNASDVLRQQVERMLADRKSRAFTENFTGQWLSLRDLKATNPDKNMYPEFDDLLELSMPRETYYFFEEVLKRNLSVLEFVDSDWTMLNQRLAKHYGIDGVQGSKFRRVPLLPECHRGGVMTQAAILKVTANGTYTSPVRRGAWILSHILGVQSPPPPKDVPALEPDVRGATTMREQLARHRSIETCAACHIQIDPPGNALENFDVIGSWREWYRVDNKNAKGWAKISLPNGGERTFAKGPNVNAADELSDGRKFADIDSFKKLVLADPDQFPRSLTERLLIYATGHGLEFADRDVVAKVVAEIKSKNYGFRALIHAIVQSPTFRNK